MPWGGGGYGRPNPGLAVLARATGAGGTGTAVCSNEYCDDAGLATGVAIGSIVIGADDTVSSLG